MTTNCKLSKFIVGYDKGTVKVTKAATVSFIITPSSSS